jgi:hypothetical protein
MPPSLKEKILMGMSGCVLPIRSNEERMSIGRVETSLLGL